MISIFLPSHQIVKSSKCLLLSTIKYINIFRPEIIIFPSRENNLEEFCNYDSYLSSVNRLDRGSDEIMRKSTSAIKA